MASNKGFLGTGGSDGESVKKIINIEDNNFGAEAVPNVQLSNPSGRINDKRTVSTPTSKSTNSQEEPKTSRETLDRSLVANDRKDKNTDGKIFTLGFGVSSLLSSSTPYTSQASQFALDPEQKGADYMATKCDSAVPENIFLSEKQLETNATSCSSKSALKDTPSAARTEVAGTDIVTKRGEKRRKRRFVRTDDKHGKRSKKLKPRLNREPIIEDFIKNPTQEDREGFDIISEFIKRTEGPIIKKGNSYHVTPLSPEVKAAQVRLEQLGSSGTDDIWKSFRLLLAEEEQRAIKAESYNDTTASETPEKKATQKKET